MPPSRRRSRAARSRSSAAVRAPTRPWAGGAFYRPTLLSVADSSLPIVQEETFGPVQTVQVFDSDDEAVALANATAYGLSACIYTRDVDRPVRLARQLDAGLISINSWANLTVGFEEGGFKSSGVGRLGGVAYMAAKGGVVGFTRALATDLAPYGITVNAICPTASSTPGGRNFIGDDVLQMVADMQAVKRIGTATDIVGTVCFLSSDDCAFVTGQTIVADGGLMRV